MPAHRTSSDHVRRLGDPSGTRDKEQSMKGDQTVIEYLNRALRHELTAVNQYWLHYRLLDN